jgi:hypothetical protein
VYVDANEGASPPRPGFEIVDKLACRSVYLDAGWAAVFQKQIEAWNAKTPTQEDVDSILRNYAKLAQNPLVMH